MYTCEGKKGRGGEKGKNDYTLRTGGGEKVHGEVITRERTSNLQQKNFFFADTKRGPRER